MAFVHLAHAGHCAKSSEEDRPVSCETATMSGQGPNTVKMKPIRGGTASKMAEIQRWTALSTPALHIPLYWGKVPQVDRGHSSAMPLCSRLTLTGQAPGSPRTNIYQTRTPLLCISQHYIQHVTLMRPMLKSQLVPISFLFTAFIQMLLRSTIIKFQQPSTS